MQQIAAARSLNDRPYNRRFIETASFATLFKAQVDARGEQVYLIYRNGDERRAFTYREMFDRASAVARFMRESLGLRRGDRISTVAYNHYDTVAIYFGAWLAGLVVVPCNVGDSDEQILFVQENAECKAVFVMPDLIARYNNIRPKLARCHHFVQISGDIAPGYADLRPALADTHGGFDSLDLADLDTEALIVCHVWGTRPFANADHSANNFPIALVSLGEGWHNNHHAFPTSARHGLKWWQFDSSYVVIKAMSWLRLARHVRVPTQSAVQAKLKAS